MCLICIEFLKGKMTMAEARQAVGESTKYSDDEHESFQIEYEFEQIKEKEEKENG